MKKLRILIDVDGIVANTLPYWLGQIGKWSSDKGRQKGTWAKVADIKQWDLSKCPPLDTVDPKVIFGMLNDQYFMINVPPIHGSQEAVQQLMDDGHEVYFVTARTGNISIPETLEWFHKHFPKVNTEKQLVFLYDKHLLGANVLIDDKPTTLVTYKDEHPEALLIAIRYPYNEHLDETAKIFGDKNYEDHTLTWGSIYACIRGHAELLGRPVATSKNLASLVDHLRPPFDPNQRY